MTNQYTRLNKHFDDFADEIMAQFNHMVESGNPLVRISPQVSLFTTYLENIEPDDNPVFRERLISAICDDNGIEDKDKKDFFLNYVENHDIFEISDLIY